MGYKIKLDNDWNECPACGYKWKNPCDLSFDENERVPCCPDCGELIKDGGDE